MIHGLLHDFAAAGNGESATDPAAMAQQAMQAISQSVASQGERSSELLKETAAAYAEILRLALDYGSETLTCLQTAGGDAVQLGTHSNTVANRWMESFMHSFENAAKLMNAGFKMMMAIAESTARASKANGKAPASGKATQ